MREIFCLVGLTCMGKSTLKERVLVSQFGLDVFASDKSARLVLESCRLDVFDVQDQKRWAELDFAIDVRRLKTWAYVVQIAQLRSRHLCGEGWGFYLPEERDILARALDCFGEPYRVHYLHLLRPLDEWNRYRQKRGLDPACEAELGAELGDFDLSFVAATVRDAGELERYVGRFIAAT